MVLLLVWILVLAALAISTWLLYSAATNKASRSIKFELRHLFQHKRIDESSRLQLALEAVLGFCLGLIVLFWILL